MMDSLIGGACSVCSKKGHNKTTCGKKLSVTSTSGDIIIQHPKFRFRKKLAAFDFDHTLVKPKSRSTFSKSADDWVWLRQCVKDIVVKYYKRGYAIVIFTNQSRAYKCSQIKSVLDTLGIPYKAYIMYTKSLKKPNPHYFNEYIAHKTFDKVNSFYVGDALGRPGDWSDSDKVFAVNCDLKYIEPEVIFPFPIITPVKLKTVKTQELVLMVGYPGSGKSTYVAEHFTKPNYTIISGDTYKSVQYKIVKVLKSELGKGQSVVLDATNSSVKKRASFLKIAKDLSLYTRVIHVSATIEQSLFQNQKRAKPVPKMAIWIYRKYYERPTKAEDIDDIITV